MKFISACALSICLTFMTASCSSHLISDGDERAAVQADFDQRVSSLRNEQLFKIFKNEDLSTFQRDALTILYAYMPLGDVTDYSGEFFLENVDYTEKAQDEMPWGGDIPEREFRHFVLPIRVNNENLDHSRKVFYNDTSRAEIGSSHTMNSGSTAKALAIPILCCCPPENSCG